MKRLIGILAFAASPAFAADMPLKAAPVYAPAFSWTGYYIGASAGYNWSQNGVDPGETVAFASPAFGIDASSTAAAQIAATPTAVSTNANES